MPEKIAEQSIIWVIILQDFAKDVGKACNMLTRKVVETGGSGMKLELFLDKDKDIYQLANIINWDWLIENHAPFYCENNGRPSVPIRVILGLHYLKYLEEISDEEVVERFCENPYWQYFCGYETFQHERPCDPSTLPRWRKKVGEETILKMFSATLEVAKKNDFCEPKTVSA